MVRRVSTNRKRELDVKNVIKRRRRSSSTFIFDRNIGEETIMLRAVKVSAGGKEQLGLPLGQDRFVTHSVFKGIELYQLRCYFKPSPLSLPVATKRGIALTKEQWHQLAGAKTQVNCKLREIRDRNGSQKEEEDKEHLKIWLGSGVYMTVSCFQNKVYVHVRKFAFHPVLKKLVPTKQGIALTPEQWDVLDTKADMTSLVPILTVTSS